MIDMIDSKPDSDKGSSNKLPDIMRNVSSSPEEFAKNLEKVILKDPECNKIMNNIVSLYEASWDNYYWALSEMLDSADANELAFKWNIWESIAWLDSLEYNHG